MTDESIEQYPIIPENVVSLKEILSIDGEDKDFYEFTEACVQTYLFTQFPQRRELAKKQLERFYNPNAQVHTLEDDGIIYAYLSLTKEKETFLFVERYKKQKSILEPAPTEAERFLWAKIKSSE